MNGYPQNKHFQIALNGRPILERCFKAESFSQRLLGLIVVPKLEQNEGLLFEGNCQQMHSLFMRYPLDLVFLDNNDHVIAVEALKPWRFSRIHMKAKKVIEINHGLAKAKEIVVGSKLEVTSQC